VSLFGRSTSAGVHDPALTRQTQPVAGPDSMTLPTNPTLPSSVESALFDPFAPLPTLTLEFPRALPASPALLLVEDLYVDDAGVLWQSRTWSDPTDDGSSTWASLEELGFANQLIDTRLVVVDSHVWRIRSWHLPDLAAWDETEDLGIYAPLPSAAFDLDKSINR
jgi:hypothetical protein